MALGSAGSASAAAALRQSVESDAAEDVAAAAAISLGKLGAPGTKDFLTRQLSRSSRYWDSIRVGALTGLSRLEDPALTLPLPDLYGRHLESGSSDGRARRLGRPPPTTRSWPSACAS